MAVAAPYNDLQPVRRIDEAEAQRISNQIDEQLKVRSLSSSNPIRDTGTDLRLHYPHFARRFSRLKKR